METFCDQFEANVFRKNEEQQETSLQTMVDYNGNDVRKVPKDPVVDPNVTAANMKVAQKIRQDSAEVLGSKLSPANHESIPPIWV